MLHECLARVPDLGLHLCRHCAEKDEWLNVAFGNDANEFTESASDMKSRISVVDRLEVCWPAPQELARQSTSFDLSQIDAETDVDGRGRWILARLKCCPASAVETAQPAAPSQGPAQ